MQITSKIDNTFLEKIKEFEYAINRQSVILLVKPHNDVFLDNSVRKMFEENIYKVINKGLLNLEIPYIDNESWLDLMYGLKSKFPNLNLGSASIKNKKAIDDSLKIGLNFSMMKYWDKDLYIYSRKKNYLLIPGLNKLDQLIEAKLYNCKIIKIYPVITKDIFLHINQFRKTSFIGAGGISISDLSKYQKQGYKGIVIGEKGYSKGFFDQKIFKWLLSNSDKNQ